MKRAKVAAPPAGRLDLPEGVQDEARAVVKGAFELLAEHTRRMAEDLTEFNRRQHEVRETIRRGGRRTSGRIV